MIEEDFISILRYVAILHSNTAKYFDIFLEKDKLGSTNQRILLKIYETPGISMQDLATLVNYHKGTITKTIQKLTDEGYVKVEIDKNDHRLRHLYTTEKFNDKVKDVFAVRKWWIDKILEDYTPEQRDFISDALYKISMKSSKVLHEINQNNENKE